MRSPWGTDSEAADGSLEPEGAGRRRVLRLAVVLWLLVGAAAAGLYLGWSISPRDDPGPDRGLSTAGIVVDTGDGHLTLAVRTGGAVAGLEIAVAPPGVTVITGEGRFPVLTVAAGSLYAANGADQAA